MTLHSPIVAMLWENWRLSRVEAAQRIVLSIVAGSGALALLDNGATVAFWILVLQFSFIYFSIAKLNGGRMLDGYKPGFPLYLLYARPVPTRVLVGVAIAYDALSSAALYVVVAALLGQVFNQAFPLLPVAVVIFVYHLGYACIQYATRSRVVQWIGSIVITLPVFFLVYRPGMSPLQLDVSPTQYVVLLLFGALSVVLTVAGVARQRRGDAVAIVPRSTNPARSGEYPDWLVNLFRFSCPTSSATRAQIWFELKSSGLPVLAIGLSLALLIFLMFAIAIKLEFARPIAMVSVILSAPILLVVLGSNAFGIRRKQGRAYASAFEMTQPHSIAQLVGLKLLVRTICVVTGLIAVCFSAWESSSLVGAWGTWMVENGKDAVPGLLKTRQTLADTFGGLFAHLIAAQAVIITVFVAILLTSFAVLAVVRARYPRRLLIAGALLLCHGIVLVYLAVAKLAGTGLAFVAETVFSVTGWGLLAAMVLVTIYLCWNGFAERWLSPAYACATVLITVAFGAAWLTLAHGAGVQFGAMPVTDAVSLLWPILLPLLISLVAPWSLSRIRHM